MARFIELTQFIYNKSVKVTINVEHILKIEQDSQNNGSLIYWALSPNNDRGALIPEVFLESYDVVLRLIESRE